MKLDPQMDKVFHALCEDIATVRSLTAWLLYQSGEWAQLQELRCSPKDYPDSESFMKDSVVTDFLRKAELPVDQSPLEARAVETFWSCEAQCAKTNARLRNYLPEHLYFTSPDELRIHTFITKCRRLITKILGRVPDDLTPRFGQGATMSDSVPLITKPDKMSKRPSATKDSLYLKGLWMDTAWARSLLERGVAYEPQVVRGNKFFTVRKDAVKRRGCCKEPSFTVSYQLSVGGLMKTRMKAHGLDLYKGQSWHRRLARKGSIDGSIATVDESNASDTLARVLVELFFPEDWFQLLDDLRSKWTQIDGKWVKLEKFSSMGNGFTFELETLIFYAIAHTLCDEHNEDTTYLSVYGDDIIVPVAVATDLLAALTYFGFEVNVAKTFTSGPFRESCGGDYFNGTAVRPHYVKKLPTTPAEWISLANGLKRICEDPRVNTIRWRYLKRAWLICLRSLPSDIRRCRGPRHLGDIVIHDDNYHTTVDLNGTPWVRAWVPIPTVLRWDHWAPSVQMASALLGLTSDGVSPRGAIEGYRFAKIPSWGISETLCQAREG